MNPQMTNSTFYKLTFIFIDINVFNEKINTTSELLDYSFPSCTWERTSKQKMILSTNYHE